MTAPRRFLYGTKYGRLEQPKKDPCLWEAGTLQLDVLKLHMERTFEEFVKKGMEVDDAVRQMQRVWSEYNWDAEKWGCSYDECPWRFAVAMGS